MAKKNLHLAVEEYAVKNDDHGDFPGLVHRAGAWAKAAELPPPPPKADISPNPLRTVDSFGRSIRRGTAQMKSLELTEETDKAAVRKKLDTSLSNLEELRRAVEALRLSLDE